MSNDETCYWYTGVFGMLNGALVGVYLARNYDIPAILVMGLSIIFWVCHGALLSDLTDGD